MASGLQTEATLSYSRISLGLQSPSCCPPTGCRSEPIRGFQYSWVRHVVSAVALCLFCWRKDGASVGQGRNPRTPRARN